MAAEATTSQRDILELLSEALRLDIQFLSQHPNTIFQCLWNRAHWHDAAEAELHYVGPAEEGSAGTGGPLASVLASAREKRAARRPRDLWLRMIRPPATRLRSALRRVLPGHAVTLRYVGFGHGDRQIVTAADDVRVWDAASGALLYVLHRGGDFSGAIAQSRDGRTLATGTNDGTVHLWEVETGIRLAELRGHAGGVGGLAFSPDARLVVSCGSCKWSDWGAPVDVDPTVNLWQTEGGRLPTTLRGHRGLVIHLEFTRDGARLLTLSGDSLRTWDSRTGREISSLELHPSADPGAANACWSPDGSRIAVQGPYGYEAMLFDPSRGSTAADLDLGKTRIVTFTVDGDYLVTTSIAGFVVLWDTRTGNEARRLEVGPANTAVVALLSPDGRSLATSSADRAIRIWDLHSGGEPRKLEGHEAPVTALAFAADGSTILSGSEDRTARIWSIARAPAQRQLVNHDGVFTSLAFSPAGDRLASAGEDRTIRFWDPASGRQLQSWPLGAVPSQLVFSPDGRRLAYIYGSKSAVVFDPDRGNEVVLAGERDDGDLRSLALAPHGQLLACGHENSLRVFDSSGALLASFPILNMGPCEVLAFSSDGRRLASFHGWRPGSWSPEGGVTEHLGDYTVRIWDLEAAVASSPPSGFSRPGGAANLDYLAERLRQHSRVAGVTRTLGTCEAGVTALAFSADDMRLVSVGRSTLVWDTRTGLRRAAWDGRGDPQAIAGGPERFPWLALLRDHEVEIWRADADAPVALLPGRFSQLVTHPGGRLWAGAQGTHLGLFRLEGDEPRLEILAAGEVPADSLESPDRG